MDYKQIFIFDSLSKLIAVFITLFTLLTFIYSLRAITKHKLQYYTWFLLTFIASLGVVFGNHIVLVLIFWGFLGLTLFGLINIYSQDKEVAGVAKKTFIIVGGSDGFLLFGFLVYFFLTANKFITGKLLIINDSLSLIAFLFIAIACFAKAGCMPFHTWVPEVAESAPIPVVAYLPAALDKLLGIYLLLRVVKDTFILDNTAKLILLISGSLTIIFAVMMALIQHNFKKLLGYHAVSQVGYMVLGIACASPLGFAAGLFHMINNAIYKCCLFLNAGNVEDRAKSAELKDLGGLAKFMPVTFFTTLIASFSISGIPPLNGFVSKWMLYQGLIDFTNTAQSQILKTITTFSLVLALVGSGLTLASFLKVNAGVFLGNPTKKVKEEGFLRNLPPLLLSLLCIIFGIFAYVTILPLIEKSVGVFVLTGLWQPTLATGFIITGIVIGLVMFMFSKQIKISPVFTGGRELADYALKLEDFYAAIKDIKILKIIYNLAERKVFDIYEQLKNITFLFIRFLRYLHNGILPTYLIWCILGIVGLFTIFFK
jgi:formate hydrogenlyase subunit 3/multisubunit Na+/H+ antiporter MnhD subunit